MRVALATLNESDDTGFVAALHNVLENSPWIAKAAARNRPFASLAALHETLCKVVRTAGDDLILSLINSHPDLAGKAALAGDMTDESVFEQGSAGLDRLSDVEFDAFQRLNAEYREKFGMPFILCVRRHTKDSILRQFERRIGNDQAAERATAVDEILKIAALRLDERVAGPDRLPVHGCLSTHVLDTRLGRPAAGVAVSLRELPASSAPRLIVSTVTNSDGRTDVPMIGGRPLPTGRYELLFDVGGYHAALGVDTADPAFLGEVPIRFSVAEPEGHYHVPLLMTPWSYSTYRGS